MLGVRGSTMLASGLALFVAIVIQLSVIGPLRLPLGRPDLVLMVLACVALIAGPAAGALLGFGAGLVGDLLSLHAVGQLALVFCLVGYLVGMLASEAAGSIPVSLAVVAAAVAAGTIGYAATSAILGEPALRARAVIPHTAAAAGYSLLVTPFLYPLIARALRRVEEGRR